MREYFRRRDGGGWASIQSPPEQMDSMIEALGPEWERVSGIMAFGAWMRSALISPLHLVAGAIFVLVVRLIAETT